MHTSTWSCSRSTDLGSKESLTSASWRQIDAEKARRWAGAVGGGMRDRRKLDLLWKHRRERRECWVVILRGAWRTRLRFRQVAVTEMEEGILSSHHSASCEQMQFETPNGRSRSAHLQIEYSCVGERSKQFRSKKQASRSLGRSGTWWGIAIL
jgi:hypothetical protein